MVSDKSIEAASVSRFRSTTSLREMGIKMERVRMKERRARERKKKMGRKRDEDYWG